ncbi:hypothetical protein VP1G_10483 [Cytospora mali]|uniref:Uncharacterized protein n=1 Tax=Cytospora mali TaxID=578113 RepID=A0A194UMD6_CYTMA|nr:hypothetical protein VP1G_10483 [Valsa mali var. pyri (nom. inval.)]
MVKQKPGLGGPNMDDLEFKPEPDDSDNIRLSDIPEYNSGDGDDGWLNDLQPEDEGNKKSTGYYRGAEDEECS